MPMQRWMHSAAGGTSQRLKPAVAMVRSRSRKPAPAPESVPALSIEAIHSSPKATLLSGPPLRSRSSAVAAQPVSLLLRTMIDARQDRRAHPKTLTPNRGDYARRHARASFDGPFAPHIAGKTEPPHLGGG